MEWTCSPATTDSKEQSALRGAGALPQAAREHHKQQYLCSCVDDLISTFKGKYSILSRLVFERNQAAFSISGAAFTV